MEIKTCKRCKKFFNYFSGPYICSICSQDLEKLFLDVKEYINEHPMATFMDVAKECEVEEKQITEWIKEGRLELVNTAGINLKCSSCGKPIVVGKWCVECKNKLVNGLKQSIEPEKPIKKSKPSATVFHTKVNK